MQAKRLFVDVDDTLILWARDEGLVTDWEPNHALFRFIEEWGETHEVAPEHSWKVAIWSTGGADYAVQRMGKARFFESVRLRDYIFDSKWNRIPEPGDIFIDDAPLPSFARATIRPREFA